LTEAKVTMKTKCVILQPPRHVRRIVGMLLLLAAVSTGRLAAANVAFDITSLGTNHYRYSYVVSGIQFQVNQELDIRFDPALYGTLSNGVAPAGFDLLLLQPNNPPGVSGDYSALSLVNNPSLSGTFSVEVVFLGNGTPGAQPFFINQLDANGSLLSVVTSGNSSSAAGGSVPEPAGWTLAGAGFLLGGLWRAVRRRRA
jgi:hypothetical protein